MSSGQTRYRVVHWGKSGPVPERTLRAPDPRGGELVELGELVEIAYRTTKWGDRGPTVYEHRFHRPLPVLVFNDSGLFICGGKYRVTMRGIVG